MPSHDPPSPLPPPSLSLSHAHAHTHTHTCTRTHAHTHTPTPVHTPLSRSFALALPLMPCTVRLRLDPGSASSPHACICASISIWHAQLEVRTCIGTSRSFALPVFSTSPMHAACIRTSTSHVTQLCTPRTRQNKSTGIEIGQTNDAKPTYSCCCCCCMCVSKTVASVMRGSVLGSVNHHPHPQHHLPSAHEA